MRRVQYVTTSQCPKFQRTFSDKAYMYIYNVFVYFLKIRNAILYIINPHRNKNQLVSEKVGK